MQVLSVENMRKSDAAAIAAGIPSKELMLRAAKGIADAAEWKPPVLIVCGSGNNAGDGYALAAILKEKNTDCSLLLACDRFSDDGLFYFNKCKELGINAIKPESFEDDCLDGCLEGFGSIADCLLGTGFKGGLKPEYASLIKAVNRAGENGAYVVSADINSGLNGNSGLAELCVVSDLTVSVGGLKSGHFLGMAKDKIKKLVNADIGITPAYRTYTLADNEYASAAFPKRLNYSHKGSYGYVCIMGGSEKYTGAVRLADMAACAARAGAGVVSVAVQKSLAGLVGAAVLESTVIPLSEAGGHMDPSASELDAIYGKYRSIAFGMGAGTDKGPENALLHILENYSGMLIIDADGINILAKKLKEDPGIISRSAARVILTPHLAEFSRLCGASVSDIENDPIGISEEFAEKNGCTLLLKGPTTVITDGKETVLSHRGCPGMATAGSGDVLSGILAAICGSCADPLLAASAAAYVNGMAGELAEKKYGSISMTASDTAGYVAEAIKSITDDPSALNLNY